MKQLRLLSCMVLVSCLMAFAMGGIANAATYYVATNGNDNNPGTEAEPWLTITKAANTLVAGDTVYIKAGSYAEIVRPQNSGTEGNYITYSAYPGDTAIVDLDTVRTTFWDAGFLISGKSYIKVIGMQVKNVEKSGFGLLANQGCDHIIFQDNYTYNTYNSGIAIWDYSHDIVIDGNEVELACNDGYQECISTDHSYNIEVTNNHVHHSGPGSKGGEGIDIKNGSHDVLVEGNYVHDINRIGIYVDSYEAHTYNVYVNNNVIHDCIHYGICIASEKGYMLENIHFTNNQSYHNKHHGFCVGDWDNGAHPMNDIYVVNNTFYNNGWEDWGAGIRIMNPADMTNMVYRNNILSQNACAQFLDYEVADNPENHIDHNLIDGFRGIWPEEKRGTDYVEGDPLFVDVANNDIHIMVGSPAIDAGSSVQAPDTDIDGESRPDNGVWDIGADECISGPQPPTADFEGSPLSGDAPLTVSFTDLSTQSPTSWSWTFGDGGSSSAQNPSHQYTGIGDYTVSLHACNAVGCDTETKVDYISVSDEPSQSCHVGSIYMFDGGNPVYRAKATVTIHDQDCQPLPGVTIYITWSGCVSSTSSWTTNEDGQVTFTSNKNRSGGVYTICVDDLVNAEYPYAPGDNHLTCNSITLP